MQEQVVLITGGNDGIGRATAARLAARGMHVVLACRDAKRGEAAAEAIRRETRHDKVEALSCDLSSFASVNAAADQFLARHDRLDILLNNAGIFTNSLQLTPEGFELQFGVNYLGHFLLTQRLMPALVEAPETRIINMTSVSHYHARIDFDNLRGELGPRAYDGPRAYAQSKLANVLFTQELARRYPDLTANCLHPGLVRTRLGNKGAGWLHSLVWTMFKPLMRPVRRGACTSVYLATSSEVRGVTGRFFDDSQCLRKPAPAGRDAELAERLWTYSEAAIHGSELPNDPAAPPAEESEGCRIRQLHGRRGHSNA